MSLAWIHIILHWIQISSHYPNLVYWMNLHRSINQQIVVIAGNLSPNTFLIELDSALSFYLQINLNTIKYPKPNWIYSLGELEVRIPRMLNRLLTFCINVVTKLERLPSSKKGADAGGCFLIDLFSSVALSVPPQDSISDVTDVPVKFDPLGSFIENWPLLGIKHEEENEIESRQAKINVSLRTKKRMS